MKRLLMSVALACVLSSTTLAGDIPAVDKSVAPVIATQSSAVVTVLLTIISAVV